MTSTPPHEGRGAEPSTTYSPYAGSSYSAPAAGYDGAVAAGPGRSPAGVPVAEPSASGSTRMLGWLGVALVYGLAIWQLAVPTVATFARSFSSGDFLGGSAEPLGWQAWSVVLPRLGSTVGIGLLAVIPVTVAAAVLGLLIATALVPPARTSVATRAVVGVLTAIFTPLGVTAAQLMRSDSSADPGQARTVFFVATTLAALPLLTAGFATAFAAVLASSRELHARGVVVVMGVALLAALALSTQLFDVPFVLPGGQRGGTQTPVVQIYVDGLQRFDLAQGSAISALLLLVSGVLGLLAVALVAATRLRLVPLTPAEIGPSRSGIGGLVVAGLVLVGGLVTVLPVLGDALTTPDLPGVSSTQVVWNTWGSAAIGTVLQVIVAVLGGAAIGLCRPAGRHSLWLLLPLAPWIFVGPGPLVLDRLVRARDAGTLDTWSSLLSSPSVVVGAVVVLAVVFAGVHPRPGRGAVAAVGGAAAGTAAVLLVTQAQSVLPALVLVVSQEHWVASQVLYSVLSMRGVAGGLPAGALGLLYPLPMFVLVAGLGVVAQLGLRRVALARG